MASFNIEISDKISVSVHVGEFGKYVQINKNTKWINVSERCWKFVKNNLHLIDESMKDNSEYGLTITTGKNLRVSMFDNQPYVCFCERFVIDGQELYKYINLNSTDWQVFASKADEISEYMEYPILYKNNLYPWSFVKPPKGDACEYRLVKPIPSNDINFYLAAYVIEKKIKEILRQKYPVLTVEQ